MLLQIQDHTTVRDVQKQFRKRFPCLHIAFYAEGYRKFGAPDSRYQYHGDERIGNIRPYHKRGAVEIKSWHSISQVEQNLKELYGLNAQILCPGIDGEMQPAYRRDELTLQEYSQLAARREQRIGQLAEV